MSLTKPTVIKPVTGTWGSPTQAHPILAYIAYTIEAGKK